MIDNDIDRFLGEVIENGTNALKKRTNPTHVPTEEKESIRWLENLKQSTGLFAEPQRPRRPPKFPHPWPGQNPPPLMP